MGFLDGALQGFGQGLVNSTPYLAEGLAGQEKLNKEKGYESTRGLNLEEYNKLVEPYSPEELAVIKDAVSHPEKMRPVVEAHKIGLDKLEKQFIDEGAKPEQIAAFKKNAVLVADFLKEAQQRKIPLEEMITQLKGGASQQTLTPADMSSPQATAGQAPEVSLQSPKAQADPSSQGGQPSALDYVQGRFNAPTPMGADPKKKQELNKLLAFRAKLAMQKPEEATPDFRQTVDERIATLKNEIASQDGAIGEAGKAKFEAAKVMLDQEDRKANRDLDKEKIKSQEKIAAMNNTARQAVARLRSNKSSANKKADLAAVNSVLKQEMDRLKQAEGVLAKYKNDPEEAAAQLALIDPVLTRSIVKKGFMGFGGGTENVVDESAFQAVRDKIAKTQDAIVKIAIGDVEGIGEDVLTNGNEDEAGFSWQ